MSGLREDLLGPSITKKRVIAVVLGAVIMIAAFAYSVMIYSWFFGSMRLNPNENYANTTPEDPLLTQPPIPWNMSDFEEFADDFDLSQEELEQLLDMYDGDIRDLDLAQMAGLIGALLFSEEEVFRIYDYDSLASVSGNLWKYECFDSYETTSWECSSPLDEYDFYDTGSSTEHIGKDIFTISLPLSPDSGFYSFVIPNLFPNPYIVQNSVSAENINEGGTILKKNALNSTTLTLDFTSSNDINMSYELFGLDLPSYAQISAQSVDEDYTPSTISENYINLPGGIETYINSHPYFLDHYNNLDAIIEESDNAAIVAYKIKTYLEDPNNFIFGINALQTDPPADDEDIVEWFCEHQEGVWSDFASAFVVFCRTFGVASRFVDGFNSRFIEEIYDPQAGKNTIPIKYKNLYNWAEIFIPTSIDGEGTWVQVDVCENISPGGVTGDFNITVDSEPTQVLRNEIPEDQVNISATLTSDNLSVANRQITFYDYSMDQNIGQTTTDSYGNANLLVNITTNQTIGPHIIFASFSSAIDYTNYSVNGTNIHLDLQNAFPSTVNVSEDPSLRIQGYLSDPIANKRVRSADIIFRLYPKGVGTPIDQWIIPNATSLNNYNIDQFFSLDPSLPAGEYEMEANFLGSWFGGLFTNPALSNSSVISFNISEEETYHIGFYIDNIESADDTRPRVRRDTSIEFKAILSNQTGGPISGKNISFYDESNSFIGTSETNASGVATFDYYINENIAAGPNRIYARYGIIENSSYYILNAPISVNLINCPNPDRVSRSEQDNENFTIQGYLEDDNSNPIQNALINVSLYDDIGTDVTSQYLEYISGSYSTDNNGNFSLQFGVDSITPINNYTLNVTFYGAFYNPNINMGSLTNFTDSQECPNTLEVYDPYEIDIFLTVDGIDTLSYYDDSNPPQRYNPGENITFGVNIFQSGDPVDNDTVYFYDYDIDRNNPFKTHTLNGSNSYSFDENTLDWNAGLHEIRVTWGDFGIYNFTYVIINKSATISATLETPSDHIIQRITEGFTISGNISDPDSGDGLRGLSVSLYLFNTNGVDYSSDLNFVTGYTQNYITNQNGEFEFILNSVNEIPTGEYYLRIDFNGTIEESSISLSDYLIHSSSPPIYINITAGSNIDGYYSRSWEPGWYVGDTCQVNGTLTYDNSTGLNNAEINITVYHVDGNILDSTITDTTNSFGDFTASFEVTSEWPDDDDGTIIMAYFYPTDDYIEYTEQELFLNI